MEAIAELTTVKSEGKRTKNHERERVKLKSKTRERNVVSQNRKKETNLQRNKR